MDINPISIFDKYRNNQYGWEQNPIFNRVSNFAYNFGGADPLRAESDFAKGNYAQALGQTGLTVLDAYGATRLKGGVNLAAKTIPRAIGKGAYIGQQVLRAGQGIYDSLFNPITKPTNVPAQPVQPLKYDPTTGASLIPGTQVYKEASNKVPALVTSMQAANNPATTTNLAANYSATTQPTSTTQSIGQYNNQNNLTSPAQTIPGLLSPDELLSYNQQTQAANTQYAAMINQIKEQNKAAQLSTDEQIAANNRSAAGQAVDLGNSAADLGMGSFGGVPVAQNQMYNTNKYQNALANRQLASTIADNKTNAEIQKASLAQALASLGLQKAVLQQSNANDLAYKSSGTQKTI